jgi:hypothetical protein
MKEFESLLLDSNRPQQRSGFSPHASRVNPSIIGVARHHEERRKRKKQTHSQPERRRLPVATVLPSCLVCLPRKTRCATLSCHARTFQKQEQKRRQEQQQHQLLGPSDSSAVCRRRRAASASVVSGQDGQHPPYDKVSC